MHKTRLANGLTVLLREMHTAPVVSFWVWYRVGSRNERTGRTGASHWVEHMLFKGTPRFPADALERSVSRTGGVWNAMTSMDWTTYYETMPSSDIDLALRLEADRMRNSSFKPADVDSERTVIISERQGAENSPMFLLGEELQAAAFRVHPYHHEVLGDQTDIQNMQRADLYEHYREHYVPNNAIVVAVGDFRAPQMLALYPPEFCRTTRGCAPAFAVRENRSQPQRLRCWAHNARGSARISPRAAYSEYPSGRPVLHGGRDVRGTPPPAVLRQAKTSGCSPRPGARR